MLYCYHMRRRKGGVDSLREIVFGLEDSLVSTLGAVTGVAVGSANLEFVLLSGLVLVVVEAISMSAGSYLSTKSAYEAEKKKRSTYTPLRASAVMFIFYLLGGCVPLTPYFLFPMSYALPIAVLCTAASLFALGFWKGKMVGVPAVRSALEMLIVSLVAAGAGYLVGAFVPQLIGAYGIV